MAVKVCGDPPTVGEKHFFVSQITVSVRDASLWRETGFDVAYRWFRNGEEVSKESSSILYFPSFDCHKHRGCYSCQVTLTSSLLPQGPVTATSEEYIICMVCKEPPKGT